MEISFMFLFKNPISIALKRYVNLFVSKKTLVILGIFAKIVNIIILSNTCIWSVRVLEISVISHSRNLWQISVESKIETAKLIYNINWMHQKIYILWMITQRHMHMCIRKHKHQHEYIQKEKTYTYAHWFSTRRTYQPAVDV